MTEAKEKWLDEMCTEIENLNSANNYSWYKKAHTIIRRKKCSVGSLERKYGRKVFVIEEKQYMGTVYRRIIWK